jgi:hypothetical protein
MSIVTSPLDLTCKLIYLQKYMHKIQIVKRVKKVNGVVYLRTEVVFISTSFNMHTHQHVA